MRTRLTPLLGLVLLAASALVGGSPAHAGEVDPARTDIVGGGTVSSSPGVVAVFVDGQFNCSGTIIGPRHVLTSSHCLGGEITVRAGSAFASSGGDLVGSGTATLSPRHDLAILLLDRAVRTSYATLADSGPAVGADTRIFGFGATSLAGPASDQLKAAVIRVRSKGCRDARGGPALCNDSVSGTAWRGDSGGPQFARNGRQVGVLSMSDGVSRQISSSVAANRAWIREVAGV
jgi:hypothetical protein